VHGQIKSSFTIDFWLLLSVTCYINIGYSSSSLLRSFLMVPVPVPVPVPICYFYSFIFFLKLLTLFSLLLAILNIEISIPLCSFTGMAKRKETSFLVLSYYQLNVRRRRASSSCFILFSFLNPFIIFFSNKFLVIFLFIHYNN
jgi:hypothetical protein